MVVDGQECVLRKSADPSSLGVVGDDASLSDSKTKSCQSCSEHHDFPQIHLPPPEISYVLLAVSGTLEEGFELRPN